MHARTCTPESSPCLFVSPVRAFFPPCPFLLLTLLLCATGIMGELTAGRADISLFPLTLTGSRPEAVDMTYSFLDGGTTILVPKGTYKPSVLGFLAPFSWKVTPQLCLQPRCSLRIPFIVPCDLLPSYDIHRF